MGMDIHQCPQCTSDILSLTIVVTSIKLGYFKTKDFHGI